MSELPLFAVAVSELPLFAAALLVSFLLAAVAMRRQWAGDRRFVGLMFAPVVILLVAPILTVIRDLALLGWAAIPLLAALIFPVVVMGWAILRISRIGITSKTEQDFEERSVDAMAEPMLANIGLVLIGGLITLVVLLAYGIARATGG